MSEGRLGKGDWPGHLPTPGTPVEPGSDGGLWTGPSTPAERVWWTRVERKARKGHSGPMMPKVLSDWALAALRVIGVGKMELVGPHGHRRWQPIPPERLTPEYEEAELRRLSDELGERLGIGPRPGDGPPDPPASIKVDCRRLTDEELDEVEEIVDRIEEGEK